MFRSVDAKVLIVGSGVAGMRAAVEAARRIDNVHLASKSPFGRGNNTYYSGGAVLSGVPDQKDSVLEHYRVTVRAGKFLNNRRLVKILATRTPEFVQELQGMNEEVRQILRQGSTAEYQVHGKFWEWGGAILKDYLNAMKDLNIAIHEGVTVFNILKSDDHTVKGVVGYDSKKDEYLIFNANAVVLATGGLGSLYARTTNPPGMAGEGYAVAADAGATLQDMEFVQFLPLCALNKPLYRMAHMWGRLYNSLGEDLIKKYNLPDEPVTTARDALSSAIAKEIFEKHDSDGGLIMEFQEDKWDSDPLGRDVVPFLIKRFSNDGKTIRVSPAVHHFMGGVVIDENCNTALDGLFAAGEVVAGIQGANRVSGNGIGEGLVFGEIAGRKASEYASSNRIEKSDIEEVKRHIERFDCARRAKNGLNPHSIMIQLREIMWTRVGVMRDEAGLKEACSSLNDLNDKLPELGATHPMDYVAALEVNNGLTVCQMIARSALERRESRGAHVRTDHPETKEEWTKNILVKKTGSGFENWSSPVVLLPSDDPFYGIEFGDSRWSFQTDISAD